MICGRFANFFRAAGGAVLPREKAQQRFADTTVQEFCSDIGHPLTNLAAKVRA